MVMLLALMLAIPLGLDLYMPVPEDNPITPSKLALGRKLFHDRRLSRSGSVACATCHDPDRAFSDSRPLAVGVFGRVGRRHAPALINRATGGRSSGTAASRHSKNRSSSPFRIRTKWI